MAPMSGGSLHLGTPAAAGRRGRPLRWGLWVVGVAAAVCAVLAANTAMLVSRVPTVSAKLPGSGAGSTVLLVASDSRERLTGQDRSVARRHVAYHRA